MKLFLLVFAILAFTGEYSAAEVFTLADGRVLTGTYDESSETIDIGAAKVQVKPSEIVSRIQVIEAADSPAKKSENVAPTELQKIDLQIASKSAKLEEEKDAVESCNREIRDMKEDLKKFRCPGNNRP